MASLWSAWCFWGEGSWLYHSAPSSTVLLSSVLNSPLYPDMVKVLTEISPSTDKPLSFIVSLQFWAGLSAPFAALEEPLCWSHRKKGAMFLYNITLQRATGITHAIHGNFSGETAAWPFSCGVGLSLVCLTISPPFQSHTLPQWTLWGMA